MTVPPRPGSEADLSSFEAGPDASPRIPQPLPQRPRRVGAPAIVAVLAVILIVALIALL